MLTSAFSALLLLFFGRLSLCDDLPLPRIVILGQTGSGKSTLANVLLGESPDCKNCTFPICPGHDSCTKHTNYAVGSWLGSGSLFTVIDTPGFGDSDNEDTDLIDEMMGVLHTVIKGANALILLIDGTEERFDASLQQMMREMQALFGEEFWLHTIIGVSHWAYDAQSVAQRNFTNKTEEFYMAEWNQLLKGKFHIEEDLMGVFIDSWSQEPWNMNDQLQQEAFTRETGKLWEFVESKDVFAFRTIEDVMNENQDLKDEVKWINDVITHNITELNNQMAALSTAHVEDIEIIRNEHTSDMDSLSEKHDKDINDLTDSISDMPAMTPLGSIVAWWGGRLTPLPSGWQRCDGTLITYGPLNGTSTPDLNYKGYFLRGSIPSEAGTFQEDQLKHHSHMVVDNGHDHTDKGHTHSDNGHTHRDTGHKHYTKKHSHEDGGHTHSTELHTHADTGHTHIYDDEGTGNPGGCQGGSNRVANDGHNTNKRTDSGFAQLESSRVHVMSGKANIGEETVEIEVSKANIDSGHATIQKSYADLTDALTGITVEDVTRAKAGDETRPKNMAVEWIMRIE